MAISICRYIETFFERGLDTHAHTHIYIYISSRQIYTKICLSISIYIYLWIYIYISIYIYIHGPRGADAKDSLEAVSLQLTCQ